MRPVHIALSSTLFLDWPALIASPARTRARLSGDLLPIPSRRPQYFPWVLISSCASFSLSYLQVCIKQAGRAYRLQSTIASNQQFGWTLPIRVRRGASHFDCSCGVCQSKKAVARTSHARGQRWTEPRLSPSQGLGAPWAGLDGNGELRSTT